MNEYLKQYIELQKQFRETEGDPDSVRALYTFKEKLELSEDKQAKEVLVDVYDQLLIHGKRAALIAADKFAPFSLVGILRIISAVFQAGGDRFSFVLMQCNQTSSSQSKSPPK